MENYFELVLGSILGFGISLLIQIIDWINKRKAANELFALEYPAVKTFLDATFSSIENDSKTILLTDIPNFKLVSQADVLLNLSSPKRKLVYEISSALNEAEALRRMAIPLLKNSKSQTSELDAYGFLYNGALKRAAEANRKLSAR